jgi:GNAT superfamily N-acetyltransferase
MAKVSSYSDVSVEPLKPEQAADLIRLVFALADYEKLERPSPESQQRLIRDAVGPQPKIQAFLAWGTYNNQQREAIGYLIVLETYSSFLALPTLFIEDVFVLEKARSCGAGRALLARAVQEAQSRGCGRVEFLVLDWNRLARNFYEKAGAEHLHDWVAYRISKEKFPSVLNGLLADPQ